MTDTIAVRVIETEVYSRVVGYYRPVSGWNLGKKQEFNERKPVKMPGESERKMNKVILIGRLGKDPELRHTQNADAVCNFTLATVVRQTGRDGQKQEKTEWHKITVWGPQAESVAQYLR